MVRILLSLCLASTLSVGLHAQQIAKSGGTSNSTFLLGSTEYARKTQCIYPPAQLTGAQSGTITRVYFKRGSTGNALNQVLTSFRFKMGQTAATGFTGSQFFTGLTTLVDSATITLPAGAAGSWFSIDLDSHFVYDATKTLIFQTSFQTSSVSNWGTFGTSNTPVKKLVSPDTGATVGSGTSSTWQDFGFDIVPLSVGELFASQTTFSVFPNPVAETIFLNLPRHFSDKPVDIQLINLMGKRVFSDRIASGSTPVLLPGLPRGAYLLRAVQGEESAVSRFVKE